MVGKAVFASRGSPTQSLVKGWVANSAKLEVELGLSLAKRFCDGYMQAKATIEPFLRS